MGFIYLILGIVGLLSVALWVLLDRKPADPAAQMVQPSNPFDKAGNVYVSQAVKKSIGAPKASGQTTELLIEDMPKPTASMTKGMTCDLTK